MAAASPLASLVGRKVNVKLVGGDEFTSDLFALNRGIAVFRAPPPHTYVKADYRLAPEASIVACTDAGAPAAVPPKFRIVPPAERGAHVAASVHEEQTLLAKRGKGVTAEAQAIFDKLSAYYPCAWAGTSIVVFESFAVGPPYSRESIAFLAHVKDRATHAGFVDRVRMMLDRFHAEKGGPGGGGGGVARSGSGAGAAATE